MWDTLKENYTEAISSVFPIHRFLIAMLGFFCVVAVEHQSHLSIVETLLRIKLASLSTEPGKILENTSVMDLSWGFMLSAASFAGYQLISQKMFSGISRTVNYKEKVDQKYEQFRWLSLLPPTDRNHALNRVSLEKKRQQKILISRAIGAELAIAFFIALSVSSYWGNALDVTVAIFALFVGIGIQANVVFVFFAKYLGPALEESILNDSKEEIRPPK